MSSSSSLAPYSASSSTPFNAPEEVAVDLLHLEVVDYFWKQKNNKNEAISDLELVGFNTGYRLIEKLTRESPKFKDELDLMKFVCKDFWMSVFRKQIDNLRTNHQGVYVLQDNTFKFLSKISNSRQYLEVAPRYTAFTCGLLRGSLANLGVVSIVTADVTSMPACKFQVQVQRN